MHEPFTCGGLEEGPAMVATAKRGASSQEWDNPDAWREDKWWRRGEWDAEWDWNEEGGPASDEPVYHAAARDRGPPLASSCLVGPPVGTLLHAHFYSTGT